MAGVSQRADLESEIDLLQGLSDKLIVDKDFSKCLGRLLQGDVATFDSVWGSSRALLTAALSTQFDHVIVIVPDRRYQDNLLDELASFSESRTERFPDCLIGTGSTMSVDHEYGDRLRVLKSFVAGDGPPIVIANIQSLLQPVPTSEAIETSSRVLSVGDPLDSDSLIAWLQENGFHQTSAVELPGEFSCRGGIFDVFATDWLAPVRIELFDDEIESLRQFETGTQRSVSSLSQIEITVVGANADSRHESSTGSLLAAVPPESLVLWCEPETCASEARRFVERSSRPAELFGFAMVQQHCAPFRSAFASQLATGDLDNHLVLPFESVERFSGDIAEIRIEIERLSIASEVLVVARVEGEIARISEILGETTAFKSRRLKVVTGSIHEGFRVRNAEFGNGQKNGVVVVGSDQIFHRTDLRRRGRRRLGKAIDSFLDLRQGDLIVHLAHGIGRYRGLKMLDKDGQETEHLELEFYGGTRIYVPASKIDLVQKYVGGSKSRPVLARIGGKAWLKQKAAAEEAVNDMACEMIELQAHRRSRPGISFKLDTEWQHEFEQSFPYRETNDQLTAIEAIKDDMYLAKPMDRLLCGDVGFGKTEVAMRAAFKAVENGYQVAMLVPTTILAEQHFRTFSERMAEFPLEIGKLSRFSTRKEQAETIAKMKAGKIDIAIGTHRIVSKDVGFYNLGLVIIDEEHRFGVEHKERLKNLRSEVDLLTMSATPIPRTLHMSLVGVRDISNLETAPEDRIPVETRVTRFNNELIRSSILRELNRGGQIFFVHNRVNDIHSLREKLESLVPEATFGVGHGQMHERDLEQVMTDFIAGRFDVLIATTIVENGLDIPNANTIFIDQAENYGLSDLHQLRGRVGRHKNRAYCYLLLEPHKHLNPTAAKRLQAIETFSEMGAGFAISMRDLEIRGAGNLLGTQQSGHIATVGYELYCQLLENAVRKQKQMPAKLSLQIDVDLPLAAFLPDSYIDDRRQKIDLYRRLTRLTAFEQVGELRDEIKDRFGPIPPAVERLLALSELKLEAAVWQIIGIFIQDKYLGFRFSDRSRFEQLAKTRKVIRIVDNETAFVTLKSTVIAPKKMLALVKSLLKPPE